MAHFSIKNENSSCEVFLFCQNKVPNQFLIFVMKYAYGSGNLNLWQSRPGSFINPSGETPLPPDKNPSGETPLLQLFFLTVLAQSCHLGGHDG